MGIILGFGVQEQNARKEIIELVRAGIKNNANIHEMSKAWNARNEEYDKMPKETAPERYTNFYVYEGKIHFSHINRRHAFSPDGWALFQMEEDLPV